MAPLPVRIIYHVFYGLMLVSLITLTGVIQAKSAFVVPLVWVNVSMSMSGILSILLGSVFGYKNLSIILWTSPESEP